MGKWLGGCVGLCFMVMCDVCKMMYFHLVNGCCVRRFVRAFSCVLGVLINGFWYWVGSMGMLLRLCAQNGVG